MPLWFLRLMMICVLCVVCCVLCVVCCVLCVVCRVSMNIVLFLLLGMRSFLQFNYLLVYS